MPNEVFYLIDLAVADGYEFTWVDGTDVDLTFWAADEPNDHQGTENCVQVSLICP